MRFRLYPADRVTECERDANMFVILREKKLFSHGSFFRPTLSRCSWVDASDKVAKRVRLKLSESIWVSDLKGGLLKPSARLSTLKSCLRPLGSGLCSSRHSCYSPTICSAGQCQEHGANRLRPVGGGGGIYAIQINAQILVLFDS